MGGHQPNPMPPRAGISLRGHEHCVVGFVTVPRKWAQMTLASPRRSMAAFRALIATSLAAALLIVVGQSSGHAATATPDATVAPPHILWPKGQAPAATAATAAPDPAQ